MRKVKPIQKVIIASILIILAFFAYLYPPINNRLAWRVDLALTYIRGMVKPPSGIPTPFPQPTQTLAPTTTVTPIPTRIATRPGTTSTRLPSPTPFPAQVSLPAPVYETQDWNNCGPATLTMYLRFYGWKGGQTDISKIIRPVQDDRNVSVEELGYYVRNNAGWLSIEYRVGGTVDTLRKFLASGFPVMIEEGTLIDKPYWPNDDQWAGHYLLLTGYDDPNQTFEVQDSYHEATKAVSYAGIEKNWQAFNHVYILVYLPNQAKIIQDLFGEDWNVDMNRQHALDATRVTAEEEPKNGFAWFNLGTNLVYFDSYAEAARAYDAARNAGLPQRMLLYQFGPYFAYFNAERFDDLLTLANYILQLPSHPGSEEAWLWHGWGLYRKGDRAGARGDFEMALKENPHSQDAQYAIDFLKNNP